MSAPGAWCDGSKMGVNITLIKKRNQPNEVRPASAKMVAFGKEVGVMLTTSAGSTQAIILLPH